MGICLPAEPVMFASVGTAIVLLAPRLHRIVLEAMKSEIRIGKITGADPFVRWGGYVHLIRAVGAAWVLFALFLWWGACAAG